MGLRTQKRALSCVYPKVVEEVMPLAEEHPAAVVVALQQLYVALRSRVLVLEHTEFAGRWDLLFDLNAREVKICSILNLHPGPGRDLFPNCGLLDLVTCNCDDVGAKTI